MYRLSSKHGVIGDFGKVVFTKRNPTSKCFIECSKSEADGIVAGGKVYAMTNSTDYEEYERVDVTELDSDQERSAEFDYIRIMAGLV